MMPARDIVVEGEDRDGGLADRESRRRDDRRQQSLEALAGLGQLGRDARRLPGCTSAPTWWATRRMMRSPSAGESTLAGVGQAARPAGRPTAGRRD